MLGFQKGWDSVKKDTSKHLEVLVSSPPLPQV